MDGQQYIIFNIAGKSYGVEISRVSSIERLEEVYQVPNTPEFIEGLVNLRGKVHTVFNLRKRLGLPKVELDETTRIVMAYVGDIITGFIADTVYEIVMISEDEIDRSPEAVKKAGIKFVSGLATKEENTYYILNLDELLSIS
ncbi:MAG: chemotaxis protein CheW [Bacillota bacterium]|nr:chemotaxis protein CheW [Bacillota bacterium]